MYAIYYITLYLEDSEQLGPGCRVRNYKKHKLSISTRITNRLPTDNPDSTWILKQQGTRRKALVSWDKVLGKKKYHITHDSKFRIPNVATVADGKVSPTLPYPANLDID